VLSARFDISFDPEGVRQYPVSDGLPRWGGGLALGEGKHMTKGNRSGRSALSASLERTLTLVAIAGVLAAGPVTSIAVAETPAQFIYQVSHSTFGDIGSYSNTVEPSQDGTTVQTRAHFEVNMLGVKMFREEATRTERWQGNRLVAFHGVTDTGKIEQVRIGSGQETTVKIDGATISAVKFEIDGSTKYTVWLDGRGVPIKFVADDDSGKVTFTLAKCIGCGPEPTQIGKR